MKPLNTVHPRWGYIVLFCFALLIPVIHNREVNRALERTRLTEGLMPANYLMLKWLGQLAIVAPIVFFTLYVFVVVSKGNQFHLGLGCHVHRIRYLRDSVRMLLLTAAGLVVARLLINEPAGLGNAAERRVYPPVLSKQQ